jgi:N6-L-threonylcarbamoyladenine synthase
LEFSFSGLKSAVIRLLKDGAPKTSEDLRNIAAAFQASAIAQLEEKVALALWKLQDVPFTSLVVAGGVASNSYLRQR